MRVFAWFKRCVSVQVVVLFVVGFLIYANSFANGFFADDYYQIVDNPFIHSLENIPRFFTGSTFYTGGEELSGNYYKPILTTTFSFLYAIFGMNPSGYHIFQVFLHILNATLVYFLCVQYFKKFTSFFLALLFLTHPINNEVVVYIANLQDSLFLFFGLSAFIIQKKFSFLFKNIVVGTLLLLSLLSKETGVLFLIIIFADQFLHEKKGVRKFLLIGTTVFVIYSVMRFVVAQVFFNTLTTAPIMQLSFFDRMLHIPYIFLYYLKTFFFPIELIIFQTSVITSFNFQTFYFPLAIVFLFFSLAIFLGRISLSSSTKRFRIYLFFCIWFFVGLLPHLQLFPLDGTVADRWFYFPIIGFLGMLAIGVESLYQRFNDIRVLRVIFILLLIITSIFSVRVMIRNTNWKNQFTLISHDISINKESYQLEEGYGLELMKLGKLDDAYPHLLRSTELFPGVNNLTSLGVYYGRTEQFDLAKKTFLSAMQYDELSLTYENYALLLLLENDFPGLESFCLTATQKFPRSYKLWTFFAVAGAKLSHNESALQAAKQAYSLRQDKTREYVLRAIEQNQLIDLTKL